MEGLDRGKKSILFISSANLTTNPRIFKEIKLALAKGFEVTFIGFRLGGWSDKNDATLLNDLAGVKTIYCDATRSSYFTWLFDSVLEKFTRKILPANSRNIFLCSLAHSKRTLSLLRKINSLRPGMYDLVVGHTLASFYPAYKAAKRLKCKFGLDVEDYHPGEKIEPYIKNEETRRKILLQELIPKADYISSASPLIAEEVNKIIPVAEKKNSIILNYFSKAEFEQPHAHDDKRIKLIWFSQNISKGRGLEKLLSVWDHFNHQFSLTLIGKLDEQFYKNYLEQYSDIMIKDAMPQAELHRELSNYDIGLALENDSEDYNRNICLTNKILAYYQAGLYILATDTEAQKAFLLQRPEHGILAGQTPEAMKNALKDIYQNVTRIKNNAVSRFGNASADCWETESAKVVRLWNSLMSN